MKFKALLINTVLLVSSILFVLIFSEIILRLLRPEYGYAAKSIAIENQSRIFINPRLTLHARPHPDTNKKHLIIHNSLGLRQHREFQKNKGKNTIRVGFFGDSFTENLRIPVEYSFTEPLDYLLNKTGQKFEVMNFGVDGYGTDQSFLQYAQEAVNLGLDIVFYIFCENDLRNIIENDLLQHDEQRNLVVKKRGDASLLNKILRKLYLSYLIIDFSSRHGLEIKESLGFVPQKNYIEIFSKQLKELEKDPIQYQWKKRFKLEQFLAIEKNFGQRKIDDNVKKTLDLFFSILKEFKGVSSRNNANFHVATIPSQGGNVMYDYLIKEGFETLNFLAEFSPIYQNKEYLFQKDAHWNEEGNKLAAIILFKFLAQKFSINYGGDEFIKQALYEYYYSFKPISVTSFMVSKHVDFSSSLHSEINSKYLALNKKPIHEFTNLR